MNRDSIRLLSAFRGTLARGAVLASALLAAGAASAASRPDAAAAPVMSGPEASIPFANHGGIYDYHAENDQGMWIQASNRQWYYATFFAPCTGIRFAQAIRFRPGPTGSLDRWSEVFSRDSGRCALTSLRSSEPPPGYTGRKAKAPAKPAAKDAPAQTLP